MNRRQDVVLRKVDIRSWTSDAARQHGIRSIPQLWLYEGTRLVTREGEEVMEFLSR